SASPPSWPAASASASMSWSAMAARPRRRRRRTSRGNRPGRSGHEDPGCPQAASGRRLVRGPHARQSPSAAPSDQTGNGDRRGQAKRGRPAGHAQEHLSPGRTGTGARAMKYAVVIEKGPRSYGAYVPDLPGCVAAAKTLAEVKKLIAQAVE